jgi:hypothetical protein
MKSSPNYSSYLTRHSSGIINLFFLGLLFLGACSWIIPEPGGKDKKYKNYQVERPLNWKKTAKANSDYAFIHPTSASIIFSNSICDKYANARLKDLGQNILRSVDNFSGSRPQKMSLAKREAWRWTGKGFLDGAPVNLDYVILRKNGCIFDLVLINTADEQWKDDQTVFNKFLTTLKIP